MARTRLGLAVVLLAGLYQLGFSCGAPANPVVHEVSLGSLTLAYEQVSSTRVGRTDIEYEFTGRLTNGGAAASNVLAARVTTTGSTRIVDGLLFFPPALPGATVPSDDTFLLVQDREQPFDPASLSFVLVPPTPSLAGSTPADGAADVPRTEWMALQFDAGVDPESFAGIQLECDGAYQPIDVHAVQPAFLVVNPAPVMPGAAACSLSWPGSGALAEIDFGTADVGPVANIVYNPTNPRATAPHPDDLYLDVDPATASGFRVNRNVPVFPGNTLFEDLLVAGLVTPVNELDGWSPVAHMVVELTDAADVSRLPATPAESLDPLAPIGLFDLTPGSPTYGERVPFLLEARSDVLSPGIVRPTSGELSFPSSNSSLLIPFAEGFVFPYFGTDYTGMYVNSNGNITFGTGSTSSFPSFPSALANGPPRISAFFTDLDPNGITYEPVPVQAPGIFVQQFADRLEVTFLRVAQSYTDNNNSFRIVLFGSGRIELRYVGGGIQTVALEDYVGVGLTPGGLPNAQLVDFSDAPFSFGPTDAVAERFIDPAYPLDAGQGFDLDGRVVAFEPNASGGYDVTTEIDSGSPVSHTLLLFPSFALEPEGRYGLVVTNRALASPTRPFDPTFIFALARDSAPVPGEPPILTKARQLTDEVIQAVETSANPPIPREDISLALRISIRSTDSIPNALTSIRQQTFVAPPPAVTITSCSLFSDRITVRGRWDAPEWRAPSLPTMPSNQPRTLIALDGDGLPVLQGTNVLDFRVEVPRFPPGGVARMGIYQHGNPGDLDEVFGAMQDLGTDGTSLLQRGFGLAAFTDPINREISPFSDTASAVTLQSNALLAGILLENDIPDYYVQLTAEQIAFLRVLDVLATLDLPSECHRAFTAPTLDVASPIYLGISQGAEQGYTFLPFAPEIGSAALVSGGGRLAERLVHQNAETLIDFIHEVFPKLTVAELWYGLSLFQSIFDEQDADAYARFLYRDPLPLGDPGRASVLLQEGLGDGFISNHASRATASALGPIAHVEPVQEDTIVLQTAASPLSANVDASTTAGYFQFVPNSVPGLPPSPGCTSEPEGHYCPQTAPEAIQQRNDFFDSSFTDPAPTISAPAP